MPSALGPLTFISQSLLSALESTYFVEPLLLVPTHQCEVAGCCMCHANTVLLVRAAPGQDGTEAAHDDNLKTGDDDAPIHVPLSPSSGRSSDSMECRQRYRYSQGKGAIDFHTASSVNTSQLVGYKIIGGKPAACLLGDNDSSVTSLRRLVGASNGCWRETFRHSREMRLERSVEYQNPDR